MKFLCNEECSKGDGHQKFSPSVYRWGLRRIEVGIHFVQRKLRAAITNLGIQSAQIETITGETPAIDGEAATVLEQPSAASLEVAELDDPADEAVDDAGEEANGDAEDET